jgi:ATP-independent RNA helicase DbpA
LNPSFSSLALKPALLANLESLGYLTMTPIQGESLPLMVDGKDVIGQAKTGSGKTAAFGLGLLQRLDVSAFRVQCLVLCPTRELADQVAEEVRRLARSIHNIKVLTLCGGVAFGPQKGSLEHGAHIIIGTPGRVEEHLRKGTLNLENLNTFILDEADRMLDMGFEDTIDLILAQVPTERQTLLFSATFPHDIERLAKRATNNAVHVKVDTEHAEMNIRQVLYRTGDGKARGQALRAVLGAYNPVSALVFCNTKRLTTDVAGELRAHGYSAQALNGDLDQKQRDTRLLRFSNRSLSVLIATDVAARGLDIENLDLVVNFELPNDPEVHTHRIGRTGRAGSEGVACSLYAAEEEHRVDMLEGMTNIRFERAPVPQLDPAGRPAKPPMVTLRIDGGKKQKVRPGDIVGALTGKGGIAGSAIGKISVSESWASVAVERALSNQALQVIQQGKIKGRKFRAKVITDDD